MRRSSRFVIIAVVCSTVILQAKILHGPYLSTVTQHSIIISWRTDTPSSSKIRYGHSSINEKEIADGAQTTLHSMTLNALESNTTYVYSVISGQDTGKVFTFQTACAGGEPFRFVVYGDTRSNHTAHSAVLRAIEAVKPRFIINSGDLVGSNTESNWDKYFSDLCDSTTVGQTIPFYASPGNHEEGKMYYDNLFLPTNNPAGTEAYFSFNYGDVHFISINTEIPYGPGSDQYQWLLSDLSSSAMRNSRFRIAFWHRPPYSSAVHGSDMKVREILNPLMEHYGVDLVFNGHDHTYERTNPINGRTYIVTGGGGAPLYDFKTDSSWTAYKEKTHHFCELEIVSTGLSVVMKNDRGENRDSILIRKLNR